jgi:iron complex outermembrane receptor protein
MIAKFHGICGSAGTFLLGTVPFLVLFSPNTVYPASDVDTLTYLKTLSIEELLQTEITSVSKKPESLFNAAAAITVITAEDIRRTGARSLPEVLRLVPGMQVGQVDGSKWEIGVRGFNDYFENKLLVLIDGRSMYTPLYSGVYWNSLDTILEDIERIEVIRGPGATVWGSNAVNGVINIITKSSKDTQGGLVSTTYGSHDKPLITTRYGGRKSSTTSYRVYGKGFKRDSLEDADGEDAHDSFESYRMGMRVDSHLSEQNSLSFQAEAFSGEADFSSRLSGFLTPPFVRQSEETEDFQGGHAMLNYRHTFSPTSMVDFNIYYDGYSRDLVVVEEERDTINLEIQHHAIPLNDHDIVWGAGVRWTEDDTAGTHATSFDPASRSITLWSAFLQDDITLVDEKLWITLGSKFEQSDFSGFEIQPSVRVRLQPTEDHLFWGAVSRAVRTPSRAEQDIIINLDAFSQGGTSSQLRLLGNDQFDSEKLIAYELGYRRQQADTLSTDLAVFYNDYDDLRGLEAEQPFFEADPSQPPHLVVPQKFTNNQKGESYGFEFSCTWQALTNLKIVTGYSWMDLDLEYKGPVQKGVIGSARNYPRHQVQTRAYYDLSSFISLDSELYYVDEYTSDDIDDYLRFDLQITWKPSAVFQLALGGENLFSSRHSEADATESSIVSSEIPTQYWLKATYTF